MKSGEITWLSYVHMLATRHHVPTVIMFDQPLFWKASDIVQGLPMGESMIELPIHVGSGKDPSTNVWLNYLLCWQ